MFMQAKKTLLYNAISDVNSMINQMRNNKKKKDTLTEDFCKFKCEHKGAIVNAPTTVKQELLDEIERASQSMADAVNNFSYRARIIIIRNDDAANAIAGGARGNGAAGRAIVVEDKEEGEEGKEGEMECRVEEARSGFQ